MQKIERKFFFAKNAKKEQKNWEKSLALDCVIFLPVFQEITEQQVIA